MDLINNLRYSGLFFLGLGLLFLANGFLGITGAVTGAGNFVLSFSFVFGLVLLVLGILLFIFSEKL